MQHHNFFSFKETITSYDKKSYIKTDLYRFQMLILQPEIACDVSANMPWIFVTLSLPTACMR